MNSLSLGWLSCMFLFFGCSYSLFKRFKSILRKINLPVKKLLNYHFIFCIIATILAFLHAGTNLTNIKFSTGYISLLLMVLTTLTGVIMKYFKKIYINHRLFWLYTHILLAIMLVGAILLHIIYYLLFTFTS